MWSLVRHLQTALPRFCTNYPTRRTGVPFLHTIINIMHCKSSEKFPFQCTKHFYVCLFALPWLVVEIMCFTFADYLCGVICKLPGCKFCPVSYKAEYKWQEKNIWKINNSDLSVMHKAYHDTLIMVPLNCNSLIGRWKKHMRIVHEFYKVMHLHTSTQLEK